MTAKAFLSLPIVDMVKQLDAWADLVAGGEPRAGADAASLAEFDEFVIDFTDKVLLPFPDNSTLEKLTDTLIQLGGPAVMPTLRVNALEKIGMVTNWAPLAAFAASLPD